MSDKISKASKALDVIVEDAIVVDPEEVKEQLTGMKIAPVELPAGVSPGDLTVAQMYANGKSKKYIATSVGLTPSKVSEILNRPNIITYVQDLVRNDFLATKTARQLILHKILEGKVQEVEEKYDGDYSKATSKDLLEVIESYDKIMKEEEKAELGTSDNTYVTLIQQVLKK